MYLQKISLDRVYYIESRRGGGGFIRIVQLDLDKDDYLLYLINERIGRSISENETNDIVTNIMEKGIITEREALIIKSALNDKVIAIPANLRGVIRANILKAMLVAILRSRV